MMAYGSGAEMPGMHQSRASSGSVSQNTFKLPQKGARAPPMCASVWSAGHQKQKQEQEQEQTQLLPSLLIGAKSQGQGKGEGRGGGKGSTE